MAFIFNPENEKKFQKDYNHKSLPSVRFGIILALIIYPLFGLLDYFAMPISKETVWLVRGLIITPFMILILIATYFSWFESKMQYIIAFSSIVAGCGITYMAAISEPGEEGFYSYYPGLILILLWTYAMVRLRVAYAVIAGIINTLLFEVAMIFAQHVLAYGIESRRFTYFLLANFFLAATNVIGAFASYYLERISRKEYLQSSMVRNMNDLLEERVRERTAKLHELNMNLRKEIQAKEAIAQKLENLAYRNTISGMFNRKSYYELSREIFALAKRSKTNKHRIVMFMDVNRFRDINETLGHVLADRLIKRIAERLRNIIRESDYIFHLGGDEFLFLLTSVNNKSDAGIVAEKIISRMTKPFQIENRNIHLTVSIGITLFPEDGQTADKLFKNADTALAEAKKDRNSYFFFTREMQEQVYEKIMIINDLHRAIDNSNFVLYYQPQINMQKEVIGSEALIRWKCPERGFVSPGLFIPVAEESGQILAIGEWAMDNACYVLKEKNYQGKSVAVNLSTKQFKDKDLVKKIEKIVTGHNIEPSRLHIEITESSIMENYSTVITKLEALKSMGLKLSIDDFGTGYSSLGYLKSMPIDILKIDRSFIIDTPHDRDSCALVHTIITMAHSFELEVVAEGVETEEQLEFLRNENCDIIQGYFYSKPLPMNKLITFIENF